MAGKTGSMQIDVTGNMVILHRQFRKVKTIFYSR
jgi:RNA-binding protein YhbY